MDASMLSIREVHLEQDMQINNKFTSRMDAVQSKRKLMSLKDIQPMLVSSDSSLDLVGTKRILLVDDDPFNL